MDFDENINPAINPSIEMDTNTILQNNRKIIISDEDKERFFKSIMVDKPYEETVELFNGELAIVFKAMTVQENSDIVNQITADRKNGIAADNDAYLITVMAYRMAVSLVSINDAPFSEVKKDSFKPRSDKDTYILARAEPLSSWSTPKLSAYIDAFKLFENKLIKLSSEIQNKNFWKASA